VTELVFDTYPLGPEVAFLFVLYPLALAQRVFAVNERVVEASGDEVSTIAVLGHVPSIEDFPSELHEAPYAALVGLHAGLANEGEEVLRPLREVGEPLVDFSAVMPFVEAQQIYDPDYPAGHRYYWKSTNLDRLSEEVIDVLVEHARAAPSKHSTIDVWLNGGALERVPESHAAFRGRSARYLVNPEANWEHGADDAANLAWARGVLAALKRQAVGGAYLNFPGFIEERQQLARMSYGPNYPRLAALKQRLDPENLFRGNVNIEPAVS
jgi:FAD/FMN-containing dehydrogenase